MGLKIKNKRGMFFTILTIAMLSLFFIAYFSYSAIEDRSAIDDRIKTMNNFVFSLEEDMSRQVYISTYRAVLSAENYITTNGSFIPNSQTAIEEALINGTISNENMSLMEGYKLEEWSSRVSNSSEKMNLLVNYTVLDVQVNQEDPWNLNVNMRIELFIKDKSNLALWNKTSLINSKVEIIGFEDPLYLIKTEGRVTNKINKTIYEPFTEGSNISNLSAHVFDSLYIASASAPSFLNRLEGNLSPDINGIESLVYLPELSSQKVSIEDKSIIDYIYFSTNNPASYNIHGMPSWFKLDNESAHLEMYGVSNLTE